VQLPDTERTLPKKPLQTAEGLGGQIDLIQQAIEDELRVLKGLSVTNLMKVVQTQSANQDRAESQTKAWIPYRESVLTQYLQSPFLEGNAKLCFVIGVLN
jgi:hypothetical protein